MSRLIRRVKDSHCGRTIHITAFVALITFGRVRWAIEAPATEPTFHWPAIKVLAFDTARPYS